jgi:hypothetical protein
MLCTMCCHGVTSSIDGVPTGATWDCPCGETNCRHIFVCSACKQTKPSRKEAFEKIEQESKDRDE